MKYLSLVICLLLAGCATPQYQAPVLSPEMTAENREQLQRSAIEYQLDRRARLYDLAWPVLTANTALCPKAKNSVGIVLADLDAYADFIGGLKAEQLLALGFADDMHVLHVMAGSPAATAGLRSGDFIRAVNGEEFSGEKPAQIVKAISEAVEDDAPVTIRVNRKGAETDIEITATESCDAAVKLSTSAELNAMALDKTIVINAGLMRNANDDLVQFIIAHELAHVALKHPRKVSRNLAVSGGVIYVPILYAGGYIADRALKLFRVKRKGSLALRGVATGVPYSKDFEAEADYVGLYMLARAGGNLDAAADIFRLFARESPATTWLRYTHPMTPERVTAVDLTVAEIRSKQASAQELLPEKRQ